MVVFCTCYVLATKEKLKKKNIFIYNSVSISVKIDKTIGVYIFIGKKFTLF